MKFATLCLFLFSITVFLKAQDSTIYLSIKAIEIEGNKKTKDHIIFREMTFLVGDTINAIDLENEIQKSAHQILKTSLFTDCNILIQEWTNNELSLVVNLVERWYTIPIPQFKLADRNFNVWWNEHNRSLDRVTYGLKFTQYNVMGLNHTLRFTALSGYRQNLMMQYTMPYFNKEQSLGTKIIFDYSRQRETAVVTDSNKHVFVKGDQFIYKKFFTGLLFTYRNKLHYSHNISIAYNHLNVGDTVITANPEYLQNDGNKQDYLNISYAFNIDYTDNFYYPLKGYFAKVGFSKTGFGIINDVNSLTFRGSYSKFSDLGKKWYLSNHIYGVKSFPDEQPFNIRPAAGFRERYVRGYELYVVDGHSYFINRNNIKYELFDFKLRNLPSAQIESLKEIPFKFYVKAFADVGYVWDDFYHTLRYNSINNNLMASYGIGVDVVTLYDIGVRFEYAFNNLSENGLFLHFGSDMPKP